MQAALSFKANQRKSNGTGSTRALRREGKIPGIIYGDKKDNQSISLDEREVVKAYHKGNFSAKLVALDVDGKEVKVVPREVQKDPVTDHPLHIDFLRVDDSTLVKVKIPVRFLNADKCPGIKRGGVLSVVRRDIELWCKASNIPHLIKVDLAGVKIGQSIHVSSIELPEGAKPTITDRDFTIAAITGRGASTAETEEESTEAESAEADIDETAEADSADTENANNENT